MTPMDYPRIRERAGQFWFGHARRTPSVTQLSAGPTVRSARASTTMDEFSSRLEVAYAARTRGDLDPPLHDLPADSGVPSPQPSAAPPSPAAAAKAVTPTGTFRPSAVSGTAATGACRGR